MHPGQETAAGIRAALWGALTRAPAGNTPYHSIREIAAADPRLCFDVALSILDSLVEAPLRARACARLFEYPEILLELLREGRYSDEELHQRCAEWIRCDQFLDLRLARLIPGRNESTYHLPPAMVARILGVLNHISSGPRLIMMLNHLKDNPHPDVAEKATVLVGRRIRSLRWVRERLSATDPRIRAAAVEGLWGNDDATARELLWQYQHDENDRVVGNALLGLHLLGEPKVPELVKEMLQDSRPAFRGTAAWVMGEIGEAEFVGPLEAAMADDNMAVRLAAKRARDMIAPGAATHPRLAVPKPETPNPKPAQLQKAQVPFEPRPRLRDPLFRHREDGSFAGRRSLLDV